MTQEVIENPAATAQDFARQFYYGWRYVRRAHPDGGETLEQVPLTIEDVLHPQEEDFVVQSDDHQRICVYLYNTLRGVLRDDPSAVVLHDTLIAWDVPDLKPLSPDIAVIFGVREQRNWTTFDVAEEGARPSLVIEVTSPSTREIDLSRKLDAYDIAEAPLYIIVDSYERKGVLMRRLLGYQMTAHGLVGLAPDERGQLWMAPVGLWIGIRDNEVECYDRDGNRIEHHVEVLAARAEAEARAAAEARARTEAEARIAELEDELKRLRGEG